MKCLDVLKAHSIVQYCVGLNEGEQRVNNSVKGFPIQDMIHTEQLGSH